MTYELDFNGENGSRFSALTARQWQILEMVLTGKPSKIIAYELDIHQRTVENHRAAIMRKTETKSVAKLTRLFCEAEQEGKKNDT